MNGDELQDFLLALVREAPLYLALFAAMIFVLARSDRHTNASLWAALGFGWLIFFGVLASAWRDFHLYEIVIPDNVADAPGDAFDGLVDALSCALFFAIQSVGYVFLVIAITIGRPWRRHAYAPPADEHDVRAIS
jgi:hypothetical protein